MELAATYDQLLAAGHAPVAVIARCTFTLIAMCSSQVFVPTGCWNVQGRLALFLCSSPPFSGDVPWQYGAPLRDYRRRALLEGISQEGPRTMYSTEKAGSHWLRSAVLVWLFLLPGANVAEAAAQPSGTTAATAVATISGSTSGTHTILTGFNQRILITRIDHKTLFLAMFLSGKPNTVTLTPGRHRIRVNLEVTGLVAIGKLWLDAEAGKAYIVRGRSERQGVQFWIEEADTGSIVGGIDPGENSDDELPPAPRTERSQDSN
jgi:hypothetical protein